MTNEMVSQNDPQQLMIGEVTAPSKPKKPTVLQRLSLYDIALEGRMIEDILIEGDGELTPETEARMDALLASGVPKIEGAVFIVKELEASKEFAKAEAKRLRDRAASFERNAEGLKARVVRALDAAFNGKVKTDRVTVYTQKAADQVSFEFLGHESGLENLFHSYPQLVKEEKVYCLNKEELLRVWNQEKPQREAWEAECAQAVNEAVSAGKNPNTITLPLPPPSILPAVIEVTETPGTRFLQVR